MAGVKERRVKTPRIVERSARRRVLFWLFAALALAGWSWFAYDVGLEDAGYSSLLAHQKRQVLKAQVKALEKDRDELLFDAARQQRASQIDRDAARRVQLEMKVLQDERAELRHQVAFLKGLINSGDGPIQIKGFRLQTSGKAGQFRYEFTVSNTRRDLGVLNGQIEIAVRGQANGVARYLRLSDLTEGQLEAHQMHFKHFQEVRGTLTLPKGFSPQTVTVECLPEGKTVKPAQRTFKWRVVDA